MALRILIAILILAVPLELPGCGPDLPMALFHTVRDPELPDDFARGHLGILQPTYERLFQVIAYRHLAGIGMNDAERRAVLPSFEPPQEGPLPPFPPNPWLEARNRVPGVKLLRDIDANRQVQRQGYFGAYLNCNDDAFRTAATTLERIQKTGHGADADWIAAQDMVFADCSRGTAIPQPATDPRLVPDRAYQIASAKFYSEQYDAARHDFQAIAADPSSPWQGIAPYLAARCLIRAGNFAGAQAELQHIAADPALSRWHAPATSLLSFVQAHLHPEERMHELALALVRPDSQATIGQDLTDYRLLFDHDVKPQPGDDLTGWILSFQAGGAGALEQWRAHQTLPWLVAALQAAHRNDTAVSELLAAAAAVKADSPAYLTVNYQRMRLMPPDDARTLAGQILNGTVPAATRNQFRAERMRLAQSFDDFLQYVARQPVAEVDYEVRDRKAGEDYIDADAAQAFNYQLPLALLRQAAAGRILPDRLRQGLQNEISVRAMILSDAPPFDRLFALLNTPGLRPLIDVGSGRFTKEPHKIDPLRDNWWCPPGQNPRWLIAPEPVPPRALPFLTAAQQAQVAAEVKKLEAAGAAPNWMGDQTLAFAQAHPQDPRVPEALYLVVRATRYGCTDDHTGDVSKRAFDLLHRRYPNSDWAKKTPYWFK